MILIPLFCASITSGNSKNQDDDFGGCFSCFSKQSKNQWPTFLDPLHPSRKTIVKTSLLRMPIISDTAAYLDWPSTKLTNEQKNDLAFKVDKYLDSPKDKNSDSGFRKKVQEKLLASHSGVDRKSYKMVIEMQMEIDKKVNEFKVLAKQHVPTMPYKDIQRAAANIWPMLSLQGLDSKKLRITNSMIGYSMLYPLSDDIVDDNTIPKSEKQSFIQRFARLISHGDSKVEYDREIDVWKMFSLIELDWNRKKHPLVYRLMSELFTAQIDSQRQFGGPVHGKPIPEFADVWEITVRKGALSILCDAFLVNGKVSRSDASFASHFGTITQFLNDIRSIDSDLAEGQYTPMNMMYVKYGNMDGIIDYVYHYFKTTFENPIHLKGNHYRQSKKRSLFFKVMLDFLGNKLLESVGMNSEKFSQEFLVKIEAGSVLPLQTLKRLYEHEHANDKDHDE